MERNQLYCPGTPHLESVGGSKTHDHHPLKIGVYVQFLEIGFIAFKLQKLHKLLQQEGMQGSSCQLDLSSDLLTLHAFTHASSHSPTHPPLSHSPLHPLVLACFHSPTLPSNHPLICTSIHSWNHPSIYLFISLCIYSSSHL